MSAAATKPAFDITHVAYSLADIMGEAATIPDLELKKKDELGRPRKLITNIEVFGTGKWNWERDHKTWTAPDLASMEEAFRPTLEDVIPVWTTNHGEDRNAGETRGFVVAVYTNKKPFVDDMGRQVPVGHRLFVDALVDEDLVAEMKAGRYNRPSVEIASDYQDLNVPGRVWPHVLTAVSAIGGKHQPAVRVTKPLIRSLAHQFGSRLPLHFREESQGRLFTVRFDAQSEVQMDEVISLLKQLLAGQEAIIAGLPKAGPPAEGADMAKKPDEAKMAEGAAPAAPAPAPAVATTTALAPPSPATPTSVTLKYSEQSENEQLKARIVALETENQVTRAAARRLQERDGVRAEVQKFSVPGNMRIAPAEVEHYTDLALAIPAGDGKLKFSDGAGKTAEMSPRQAFFASLTARPDQTKMLKPSLVHLNRPASAAGVLAFAEQAKETAKTKGITEEAALQQQLEEITDVAELHELVFGSNGSNGQNSAAEA